MANPLLAGLRAIRRTPLQQSVAIGTVAVALLLSGALRLAAQNVQTLSAGWGGAVQITVYLDDNATPQRAKQIAEILGKLPGVARIQVVDPREAYARLQKSLGERADVLDGVEDTMLPLSIEVGLEEGAIDLVRVDPTFLKLRAVPGIEDVELMGDWVQRVQSVARLLRRAGLALGILVSVACVYVIASTIRLGVFARREEIEILKLVGATDGFVRAPFLVEGMFQGLCGAALALALLYGLHHLAAPWIEGTLGPALCPAPLAFLPRREILSGVAAGFLLGLCGSAFAVGRHVNARPG